MKTLKKFLSFFVVFVTVIYSIAFGIFSIVVVSALMPPGMTSRATLGQWIMNILVSLLLIGIEIVVLGWIIRREIKIINEKFNSNFFNILVFIIFTILFFLFIFWVRCL